MMYLVGIISVSIYSALLYFLVCSETTETPFHLLLCILLGGVSAGLALFGEYIWNLIFGDFIDAHRSLIFLESFIGVGSIEELAKWVWLVFLISHWRAFTRYTDGILYACCIAAGFSLVEGVLYVISGQEFMSILIRSFTAVPIHFLFAIIMGFLFARYKFESHWFLWFSWVVPVILHGLYDFFIFQKFAVLLMGGALLVLAGCLSLSIWVCLTALQADRFSIANR